MNQFTVPWRADQIETLRRMLADGATFGQIASATGKTRNAVAGKAERLGLRSHSNQTFRPKPAPAEARNPAQIQDIERMLAEQKSWREIANDSKFLTILQLRPSSCRFPLGDPKDADFRFCGARKEPGASYCGFHRALCLTPYRPGRALSDAHREALARGRARARAKREPAQ